MTDVRLNDANEAILGELSEGRATAVYLSTQIEWKREYITQRLRRLEEHGVVSNLEDTGLYELTNNTDNN
jgi:DNA-binding HxlR family transcriptional regulator